MSIPIVTNNTNRVTPLTVAVFALAAAIALTSIISGVIAYKAFSRIDQIIIAADKFAIVADKLPAATDRLDKSVDHFFKTMTDNSRGASKGFIDGIRDSLNKDPK